MRKSRRGLFFTAYIWMQRFEDVAVIDGLQAYLGEQGLWEWKPCGESWCAGRAKMAETQSELLVLHSP